MVEEHGSWFARLHTRWRVRRERRRFVQALGYAPDLERPTTYNEKQFWRKVRDRNPLFPVIQDKCGARDYLRRVIGSPAADRFLPQLLHVTHDPATIPWDELTGPCAIKATHGCGWNLFVRNGSALRAEERRAVIATCRKWLRKTYGRGTFEWAYSQIEPRIIVEEFLDDGQHPYPLDYKFMMFGSVIGQMEVHSGRHVQHQITYYDRSFRKIGARDADIPESPPVNRPASFESMVELTKTLGREFDHVRIDLFDIRGRVMFGEFTVYPGAGRVHFLPRSYDKTLGSYWTLPR